MPPNCSGRCCHRCWGCRCGKCHEWGSDTDVQSRMAGECWLAGVRSGMMENTPSVTKSIHVCFHVYLRVKCWILSGFSLIGFHSLDSEDFHYDLSLFTSHTHEMYLHILVQRYQTSQVSRQVPVTPSQQPCSSFISISSNSPCNSPTPSLIQDVTKARTVQNGCFREMNGNVCAKETYILIWIIRLVDR